MKKSVSSRIKITKNGKILRKKMGVSHFMAKKPRRKLRRKKNLVKVNKITAKMIQNYS
ncbi:MAG: 50S ribosomal protein L35 [Candidatus Liptonbacteria bacterium]|nr:50S ribosomal protein L35 [Candidatus Liptonbacteria bacterium]